MASRARGRALLARGVIGHRVKITRGLPTGSLIRCADNSGARVLRLVQVVGYKGRLRRVPSAAVGDMVVVSVRRGTPDMRKKLFRAVIVRQRKPYRRKDGTRIKFEDNACVILKSLEGDPKGSVVKGPVAREVIERFPKIGKISSIVV